jgi:hypothetical protein
MHLPQQPMRGLDARSRNAYTPGEIKWRPGQAMPDLYAERPRGRSSTQVIPLGRELRLRFLRGAESGYRFL